MVSNKYLFLCSPPKIVFALRPDSRPTLMKLTPISFGGGGYELELAVVAWFVLGAGDWFESLRDNLLPRFGWSGRARARTLSRGRTSAERLSDLRNARRVEDKWNNTFPRLARAKICRCFVLYGKWPFKLTTARDRRFSLVAGPSYRERKKNRISKYACVWREFSCPGAVNFVWKRERAGDRERTGVRASHGTFG